MKFLIVIAVIVQLSLADQTDNKVVQPANDKLYPIFDMIATKMQAHIKIHSVWFAVILNEMLPEYKQFMETHNTKEYKEFNEALLQAISTLEQFAKDPENCRLQRAVYTDSMRIFDLTGSTNDLKEFIRNFGQKKHLKTEEDKSVIRDIAIQFPDLIKNFIESLAEEEKQKNPELFKAAEAILKATATKEKFSAIHSFMIESQYEKNLIEANDENCKWDLTSFDSFVMEVLNDTDYVETN